MSYFKALGRTERDSTNSDTSRTSPITSNNPDHDSGYAETSASSITPTPAASQRNSKMSGKQGAMVYGIVMYDFQAERADELEAKAGEAIIVIAQSNPEWFVAKPIGRLGGPGLIPVSFIEIRDMASNTPVPNPQDAIKKAGIPKVEEWKKMAADYKNSSITLGKFDAGGAPNPQALEQGMERMSLQGGGRTSQQLQSSVSNDLFPPCFTTSITNTSKIARLQFPADTEPTISSKPSAHKRWLAAIRSSFCSHPPLLLCRRQILVRHRSRAGGWSTLGAFSILRRLLRLPNCFAHRVPGRGWEHWHTKTFLAVYARSGQLRDRRNY